MRVLYKAIDNYTLTFSSMILPSETISISPIECIDRQSSSCGNNIRILDEEEPELSACSAHSTVSIDTDDETIMTGNRALFPKKHNHDKLSCESNHTMTTTSHSLHDVIRLTYQRNVYPKRPLRQQIIDDLKQQRIVEEEQEEVEQDEEGQHEQQHNVSNQGNNQQDDEEEEQGMTLLRKKTRNHQEEEHQQIQHQSKKNLIKGILVHPSILLQKKSEREVSGNMNQKTVHFMTDDNDDIVSSIQQTSPDISSSFNIYEYRKDLFYSKRELRNIQSKAIYEVKNDIPDIMKELVQSWYKVCSILPSNNVEDNNNNNSQNIVDIDIDDKVDMANELQSVAHDWCDTDYRGYEPIILSLLHSQSSEDNNNIISLSKFAIPDQRPKLIQSIIRYYKDKKKYIKNQSKKPELLLPVRTVNEWNELLREASVSVSKKSVEFALQLAIGDSLIVKEFYNDDNNEPDNDDDSDNSETTILLLKEFYNEHDNDTNDDDDDNSETTILLLDDDLDYMYEIY